MTERIAVLHSVFFNAILHWVAGCPGRLGVDIISTELQHAIS